MKATLGQLEQHIKDGVIEVLRVMDSELIIKSNCPDDNDTMLGLAMCMLTEEGRVVVVGNEYDKLSEKSKVFAYYHEIAHHIHGDSISTNTVDNEVAADMYSADRVGHKVAYVALTELIGLVESYEARNEVNVSHIEAIKKPIVDQIKYRREAVFKKLTTREKVELLIKR